MLARLLKRAIPTDTPVFTITPSEPQIRLFHLLGRFTMAGLYRARKSKRAPGTATYVPVPVANLDFLGSPDKLLNSRQRQLIRGSNAMFFFDMSIETISFEGYSSKKLLEFHKMLKAIGLSEDRVVLLSANARAAQSYDRWAQAQGIADRITMLGYNFYLFEYAWELMLNVWFRQNGDKLLTVAKRTVTEQERRSHYFMCLNLRPRAHRTAVVLHLMERGWLGKGIVTYFGEEFGSKDAVSVDTPDGTKAFIATLPSSGRLLSKWDELHCASPLTYERDSGQVRNDLWQRKPGEVDFLIPEVSRQQGRVESLDSYFEIVNETWLTGPDNLYITEKTIRPIIRLQPFIHVGCPRLLEYLRSIGFKTFAPLIDESYDAIDDKTERMEAIFKEIDRLCAMSEDDIHKLYCGLWPVLEHNYQHFRKHMKDMCRNEVKVNIFSRL